MTGVQTCALPIYEQFFNISIYENFYLVCQSRNKIFREIKNLGLTDLINSFDGKFNFIINSNIEPKQKFFLGIARAYLSGAKIINIYKLPENFSKSDRALFRQILKHISKHCTIICYFNEPQFDGFFDNIYEIENNKIKTNNLSRIANNNNRN